jgi:phosphoglycerate dehydrogenase-like enzyme
VDRVVVTHRVHPEAAGYLAGFCEPALPDAGVWPAERAAELAAGAGGLIACMADRVDEGHPACVPARLLAHPRTPFTPHLGSAVDGVRRKMSFEAARQVRQVLEGGRPDHAVREPRRRPG